MIYSYLIYYTGVVYMTKISMSLDKDNIIPTWIHCFTGALWPILILNSVLRKFYKTVSGG